MKKIIFFLLACSASFAQEHFNGISISNRVGLLNATINPAELPNLSKKFEVNIYGMSFGVANNKIGFSDLNSDTNFETLIFQGNSPVDARIDTEILGPGFAMRWRKWGFALSSKAYGKFDMAGVDPTIGNAINNNNLLLNTTLLNNPNNQKLSGVAYGEIGLSAGRTVFETDSHRLNAGITMKLLFPGSYSNLGLSNLQGEINQNASGTYLTTNGPAVLNVAYSGNLAESFTNFDDYTKSVFGGLNGFSGDIGVNYHYKKNGGYKLNAGLSIRNIGSMTFKDDNNYNTTYSLNIQPTIQNPQGLDLSLFQNVESLSEVEQILIDNGYLTQTPDKTDFKVNLPTTLNVYVDYKIIPKLYVSAFMQQRLKDNLDNQQVTASNVFSITPRVNLGFFETYVPVTIHEISGTNVGLGFRLGGFYLGTSSMITALISDQKQADFYLGFRWGFL